MDSRITISETLNSLRATLEQMARWGCAGFECSPETLAVVQGWADPGQTEKPHRGPSQASTVNEPPDQVEVVATETLEQIRSELGDCRRCGLAAGRTHIVYGEGEARARLVFVGEGPGFEEDRSGRPFVGPAGQLLTKIIQGMKLTREQVYICNVIKCRPPDNRDPLPKEIATCRTFLERQIAAVKPEVICTLGTHATQTLLNTIVPVSKLRGRFHNFQSSRVMPTYHPAYLLRNPDRKRDVWEDMKKIMALLRIPL
jgi:uracil-DNA glycosylase family 4